MLPGTNARSGMNAPNGTPMKRLLSTSQTEQFCACAEVASVMPVSKPAAATIPMSLFMRVFSQFVVSFDVQHCLRAASTAATEYIHGIL